MPDPMWAEFPSDDPRYNASEYRRFLAMITGGQEGVWPASGLKVTQRGSGANMSVDVATGSALVASTEATRESYQATFTAVSNRTIPASSASGATKHLVVVRVRNALEFAGSATDCDVVVLSGTSGANTDPALQDNCLVLARVTVPANASSVTNAMVTDLRTAAQLLPGVCTDATRPADPITGQTVAVSDLGRFETWGGTAWLRGDAFSVAGRTQVDLSRVSPAQPVADSTRTQIFWNQENSDGDGLHSANAGPVTMTDATAGRWSINVTVDWDQSAGVNQWLEIDKDNGGTIWRFDGGAGGAGRLSGAVVTKINSGVPISIYVVQGSGAERNIASARLEMHYVGP